MTVKEQVNRLKENWLLLLLVVLLVLFAMGGTNIFGSVGGVSKMASMNAPDFAYESAGGGYGRSYDQGFAPEIEERIILKTANMNAEVERGAFQEEERRLRSIVEQHDGFILNENANRNGEGATGHYTGSYQLKIPVAEYDEAVAALKGIGKVTGFRENAVDITGQYLSVEDELDAERGRLTRFIAMLDDATRVEDKIQLTDRIYDLERSIKHLEERLEKMDDRVDYADISVTLTEERSSYMGLRFVRMGELVRLFVESLSNLFRVVFALLPWAIALLIVRIFWRIFRRSSERRNGQKKEIGKP